MTISRYLCAHPTQKLIDVTSPAMVSVSNSRGMLFLELLILLDTIAPVMGCRSSGDITAVLELHEIGCIFWVAALTKALCWEAQATMHLVHFCENEDKSQEQTQLCVLRWSAAIVCKIHSPLEFGCTNVMWPNAAR